MLTVVAFLLELLVPTVAYSPAASTAPLHLAIPPFVAQPIGMNDEVLPTGAQLAALQASFARALNSTSRFRATTIAQICSLESSDGCSRSRAAASRAGAAVIIQGYVTRHMAIWWDVDFVFVDARTGRSSGPWDNEIKGDFDAVLYGMPGLAADAAKRAVSIETRA
jgi:hypothetical protein